MDPVIMFAACGLLAALPDWSLWLLPVYAGLLAWNRRPWLAFGVLLVFAALRG